MHIYMYLIVAQQIYTLSLFTFFQVSNNVLILESTLC